MKRQGDLYPMICSFENLVQAAYRARRGKRLRRDVVVFHDQLETELLTIHEALMAKTYEPGAYRSFPIRDPKPRLISAAPYRDRVVHHALCQVIEPLFDKGFIECSYANRIGKGTHQAIERCSSFAGTYDFVLKCDIEKYFPSIDHEILMERIKRKIKCPDTLWLIRKIVDNSNPQGGTPRYFFGDDLFTPWLRRRGIPIGNLTSQFFANVYLDGLDHFLKEELGCKGYLRFCDDFLVFGNQRSVLHERLDQIRQYLCRLRLQLHPKKCQMVPTRCGVEFLGWRIFPDHRRLRRSTGVRFQRKLRSLQVEYSAGRLDWDRVNASLQSWIGHLKLGDTWGLRRKLLGAARFVKAVCGPSGSEEAGDER